MHFTFYPAEIAKKKTKKYHRISRAKTRRNMYLLTLKSQVEILVLYPDLGQIFKLTFLGRQIHVSRRLDERNSMVFFVFRYLFRIRS